MFVGFLTGVFAVPTAYNLGVRSKLILLALPLILPPFFALGVWIGKILGKKIAFLPQFSRFVAIGFLNTAIDFGVLNLLSSASGVTSGLIVGGINIPGFLIAVTNSYVWNKLWVFRNTDGTTKEGFFHDLPKFLAVTVLGVALNSGIVVLATTYINPIATSNASVWLNLAKAAATLLTLVWNFLGYKFVVFKK